MAEESPEETAKTKAGLPQSAFLAIVFFLLLVIVGGGAFFLGSRKAQPSPTASPTEETAIPTASPE